MFIRFYFGGGGRGEVEMTFWLVDASYSLPNDKLKNHSLHSPCDVNSSSVNKDCPDLHLIF